MPDLQHKCGFQLLIISNRLYVGQLRESSYTCLNKTGSVVVVPLNKNMIACVVQIENQ